MNFCFAFKKLSPPLLLILILAFLDTFNFASASQKNKKYNFRFSAPSSPLPEIPRPNLIVSPPPACSSFSTAPIAITPAPDNNYSTAEKTTYYCGYDSSGRYIVSNFHRFRNGEWKEDSTVGLTGLRFSLFNNYSDKEHHLSKSTNKRFLVRYSFGSARFLNSSGFGWHYPRPFFEAQLSGVKVGSNWDIRLSTIQSLYPPRTQDCTPINPCIPAIQNTTISGHSPLSAFNYYFSKHLQEWGSKSSRAPIYSRPDFRPYLDYIDIRADDLALIDCTQKINIKKNQVPQPPWVRSSLSVHGRFGCPEKK